MIDVAVEAETVEPAPVLPNQPAWELVRLRHRALTPDAPGEASAGPVWTFVLEGVVELATVTERYVLDAGDAVLLDAFTPHRLSTAAGARVATADLRLVVPPFPVPSPLLVRDFAGRHYGVAELVRSCPLGGECRPSAFASSYGGLIGASMLASWQEDKPWDNRPGDPAVVTVLAALVAEPGAEWTVEWMAGLVHLSRSALNDRFRRALGRSPVQALREVRMLHARRLLADVDRPIEQIAHAVGYGSTAAFSRAFTADHGTAPKSWRTLSDAG
ncbi:AraC family transcriptional regulator [Microlunatus parietis]|uniref:AraC-like DNA-binding protein n=1 Tax=Microlunatus parietis TaxID=682979 RepID=A0A7Y9I2M0_9ACTN|nr:AraC family transcriptional regulator [Microlunatus parietis]NYE68920.1 AraC-like DNA-binding protein [Microlunatus parietis]